MTFLPLCQVALSVADLLRTHDWYQCALGFVPAGPRRHREVTGRAPVSGLPESSFDVWCLADARAWSQLEVFEFARPRTRRPPADARVADIGYSMIGLQVDDFDEALARLRRTSGRLLTAPVGEAGRRRVCLRDPDGVLLELMEDDVLLASESPRRTGIPVAVRVVTLSVPDLALAAAFWAGILGLEEVTAPLHGPEHDALWGLEGSVRSSLVLRAGDCLLELVQYHHPVPRNRPAGYQISDQGILNVALGSTDRAAFDAVYERVLSAGCRPNSPPWTLAGVATVVYVTDSSGFSVELLHVEPTGIEEMGFDPGSRVAVPMVQ